MHTLKNFGQQTAADKYDIVEQEKYDKNVCLVEVNTVARLVS